MPIAAQSGSRTAHVRQTMAAILPMTALILFRRRYNLAPGSHIAHVVIENNQELYCDYSQKYSNKFRADDTSTLSLGTGNRATKIFSGAPGVNNVNRTDTDNVPVSTVVAIGPGATMASAPL